MLRTIGMKWSLVGLIATVFISVAFTGQCAELMLQSNITMTGSQNKYVAVNKLNCRVAPVVSANVLILLKKNQMVKVLTVKGEWSQIGGGHECWVLTRYLSDKSILLDSSIGDISIKKNKSEYDDSNTEYNESLESGAYSNSGSILEKNKRTYNSKVAMKVGKLKGKPKKARTAQHKKRNATVYTGGTCPCSGSNVCIGPRGGRYCITSGGNKRYGV